MLRPRTLTVLAAAAIALAGAGCGSDDEDENGNGGAQTATTTPEELELVEASGKLPRDLVKELEGLCAKLQTDVGGAAGTADEQAAEANAAAIDELQNDYIAALEQLADRVPERDREAFQAYIEAQAAAFALSPPTDPEAQQAELEAANAAAEAQAAELGFSSCSGV